MNHAAMDCSFIQPLHGQHLKQGSCPYMQSHDSTRLRTALLFAFCLWHKQPASKLKWSSYLWCIPAMQIANLSRLSKSCYSKLIREIYNHLPVCHFQLCLI